MLLCNVCQIFLSILIFKGIYFFMVHVMVTLFFSFAVFNEKAVQKQSSKQSYKLKKFELMSCLLREKNPDKIYKLITDLHKMNVNVKQIASRWNVDDAHRGVLMAAASLVGSGPRAQGPDSDYPMILLAKLKQVKVVQSFFLTFVC